MPRLTSSESVTVACSPTSSTVTEAVPLPACQAPGTLFPAQAAAIRRRGAAISRRGGGDAGAQRADAGDLDREEWATPRKIISYMERKIGA